jgi:hypothetical protein
MNYAEIKLVELEEASNETFYLRSKYINLLTENFDISKRFGKYKTPSME